MGTALQHHAVGWSTHPPICAGAGDLLSLAQADLAAAPVPARAAGPPHSGPQHGETGPGQCSAAGTSRGHIWWRPAAPCEQICFPTVQLQLCWNLPCGVLNTLGNTIIYLDFSSKWPKSSLCQHSLSPSSSQCVVTNHHTVESDLKKIQKTFMKSRL